MSRESTVYRQVDVTRSWLVVVLASSTLACGPQSPASSLVGEWQRDPSASFSACDPDSFAIRSAGEGTYSITEYVSNPRCGYPSPQVVNGVFMTESGRSILHIQYEGNRPDDKWIYLPEAKKINVNEHEGSFYSRTSRKTAQPLGVVQPIASQASGPQEGPPTAADFPSAELPVLVAAAKLVGDWKGRSEAQGMQFTVTNEMNCEWKQGARTFRGTADTTGRLTLDEQRALDQHLRSKAVNTKQFKIFHNTLACILEVDGKRDTITLALFEIDGVLLASGGGDAVFDKGSSQ